MPADIPRFDEGRRRSDAPAPDPDERVDLLAMEDEAEELERKELAEAERRAAALCRQAQRGDIEEGLLEGNELDRGHTIERHVGKDDAYLHARGRYPSSTFTDLPTADRAVSRVLVEASGEIDRWLADTPSGARYRIEVDLGRPAGRVAEAAGVVRESSTVRCVLLRTDYGYRLLTNYLK